MTKRCLLTLGIALLIAWVFVPAAVGLAWKPWLGPWFDEMGDAAAFGCQYTAALCWCSWLVGAVSLIGEGSR